MPDIYMKLVGWPIVIFSIEFAMGEWAPRHVKQLLLICCLLSPLSGLLLWECNFSGPFLLNWCLHVAILPSAMAKIGKNYEKKHPNERDYPTQIKYILGVISLCIGAFFVVYGIIPNISLFTSHNIAHREILASRILYISYGTYAIMHGISIFRKQMR